jgi:hypothetical protein
VRIALLFIENGNYRSSGEDGKPRQKVQFRTNVCRRLCFPTDPLLRLEAATANADDSINTTIGFLKRSCQHERSNTRGGLIRIHNTVTTLDFIFPSIP